MRIAWGEKIPLQDWLPRRHPTHGLLSGDEELLTGAEVFFSAEITSLPPPRSISPQLLRGLEDYHRELDAPPESLASLHLLSTGAQAVVTGQQAGLLGGPFLTILKCLTAIRLAGELSRRWERPFVPVFWSESEDHDIEEANRAFTLGSDHQAVHFELSWPEEYRQAPAGLLPLGAESESLLEDFFSVSGSTEFSAELRRQLLEDLQEKPNFSRWFSRQMLRLLGDRGLVIFDSLEVRFKAHARPLWAQVLEEPLHLTAECRQVGKKLAQKGYRPALAKTERRCPFFLLAGRQRLPVVFERGIFRAGKREHTLLELRCRLDEHPEDFSAGVILRPLLQDYLLPTAVYVGGPTELSYFPQILPGYRWVNIPPPTLVLRASLTLVEPAARRVLDRYRIAPQSLRSGIDPALNALIRRENRLASPGRWEKLREKTLKPLDLFRSVLGPAEPGLAEKATQTRGKIEFLLNDLEARAVATLRKRSEVTRNQLLRTRLRLYPLGQLQERNLSPYYFLNKYGPGLLTALAEEIPVDFTHHHFGTIVL